MACRCRRRSREEEKEVRYGILLPLRDWKPFAVICVRHNEARTQHRPRGPIARAAKVIPSGSCRRRRRLQSASRVGAACLPFSSRVIRSRGLHMRHVGSLAEFVNLPEKTLPSGLPVVTLACCKAKMDGHHSCVGCLIQQSFRQSARYHLQCCILTGRTACRSCTKTHLQTPPDATAGACRTCPRHESQALVSLLTICRPPRILPTRCRTRRSKFWSTDRAAQRQGLVNTVEGLGLQTNSCK